MIGGALMVRTLINSDSDSDADSASGDGGTGDSLELICGTELLAACNEIAQQLASEESDLRVSMEAEQITAQRIADGELVLSGQADSSGSTVWLAAGPWPEIAEASGLPMPTLAGSDVLARSPAVIVALKDRMEAIIASCTAATWACIGDHAGGEWTELGGESTWGRIEVGLPQTDAGDGMVTVNQAVASRVGSTEFATNDLDSGSEGGAVGNWFDRLATESNSNDASTTPLTRFLRVPGSLGVVGALESEAIAELSTAAAAATISVVAPQPVATADVRLWAGNDASLQDALDRLGGETNTALAASFTSAGWRAVATDGTTSVPPTDKIGEDSINSTSTALPEDDGLPAPGVISAVDSRWENAQ
jgi:hypothetical protein